MTSNGEKASVGARAPTLRGRNGAWLLGVRVIPSAACTEVRGLYGDRLKIAVNAPPEAGKANARVVEALAGWLDVPARAVRVESGHGGRDKVVAFSGIQEDELRERLDRLLGRARRTGRNSDER